MGSDSQYCSVSKFYKYFQSGETMKLSAICFLLSLMALVCLAAADPSEVGLTDTDINGGELRPTTVEPPLDAMFGGRRMCRRGCFWSRTLRRCRSQFRNKC